MSLILIAVLALLAMCLVFGAILGYAAVRFRVEGDPIAEQVNALLPQTQCGQCGYPGCKPYAEAIAKGDKINKCPPGGEATIQALADLLDVEVSPWMRSKAKSRRWWPLSARLSALAALSASRPARWMP